MTQSQTFTDSHKQEMVFFCTELYRTPKLQLHNNACDQNLRHNFINTTERRLVGLSGI